MKRIAIGLVRRLSDDGWRWLAEWNGNESFFEFVQSECLERESPREAISREVSWRMELDRSRDLLVCNMAQADLEVDSTRQGDPLALPQRVSFYNVELYGKRVVGKINLLPGVAWLSSQEICKGVTLDNRPINPDQHWLVSKFQVIQHWESSQ